MAFSTSICLTNTGNLPSGCTLNFYSNADNYTQNFNLTAVPLASITGVNCPYTLTNVPEGTTKIKIKGPCSNCCVILSISPNDPCSFCDLGFDQFSASTIGRIVAGNLTGSCSLNITDYVIDWYEITNPNSPVFKFTSGRGTLFTPYGPEHPLVGTSSYLVPPGIYKPYLKKIRINNVNYSSTLISGFVQANLDCFAPISVNVTPLTCSNGDLINNDYTHQVQFSGASQGQIPTLMQQVFQLSPTTNYLAWRFWGYDISDTIKITYYGSHYNNSPIILEYWNIGNNNINSYNYSSFPKVAATFFSSYEPQTEGFVKVTNLMNIVRSVNDYVLLEIIPNQQNSKTNFKLQIKCLETFNCTTCFDNYVNTGLKIIQNSLSAPGSYCNQMSVNQTLSGCSETQLSTSDLYKYSKSNSLPGTMNYQTPDSLGKNTIYSILTVGTTSCSGSEFYGNNFCSTQTTNVITFTKDNSGPGGIGNVRITFSNQNDFNSFYDSYLFILSLKPISTNPTTKEWYRYTKLTIPQPLNANDPCGDTTTFKSYNFHTSSLVTSGITGGNYFMNLTMPKITKQMSFTNCQLSCDNTINTIVNDINTSSDSVSYSNTNYKGSRIQTPFNSGKYLEVLTTVTSADTRTYFVSYSKLLNDTKPFSANTNGTFSYIGSLSASTCSFDGFIPFQYNNTPAYGDTQFTRSYGSFKVIQNNPLNASDFKIQASPIVNGFYAYSGPLNLIDYPTPSFIDIYQQVNGVGTVLQPSYFI